MVVIGKLLTSLYRSTCNNPHGITYNVAIAVRDTCMIYKARQIPINIAISGIQMIDTETPNLATNEVSLFPLNAVTAQNLFTCVMKNSLVLIDVLNRKDTPLKKR